MVTALFRESQWQSSLQVENRFLARNQMVFARAEMIQESLGCVWSSVKTRSNQPIRSIRLSSKVGGRLATLQSKTTAAMTSLEKVRAADYLSSEYLKNI